MVLVFKFSCWTSPVIVKWVRPCGDKSSVFVPQQQSHTWACEHLNVNCESMWNSVDFECPGTRPVGGLLTSSCWAFDRWGLSEVSCYSCTRAHWGVAQDADLCPVTWLVQPIRAKSLSSCRWCGETLSRDAAPRWLKQISTGGQPRGPCPKGLYGSVQKAR